MEVENLICFKCRHFRPIGGGCDAFEEIPSEITSGENEHREVLSNQKNDIVFQEGEYDELKRS
jgi:hypothetical protein